MGRKNPVGPKRRRRRPRGGAVNDRPIRSRQKNRPEYWRVVLTDDEDRSYVGTGPTQPAARNAARQFAVKQRQRIGLPPPPPANQMAQLATEITDGPHPRI